eukprot:GEMP01117331.1.p1 GENE.GEMP01117331.1~~GEMP01117331.1.p1  ORF type:complete len:102 (-),score=10.04 GEMP01117331.1:2-307(-)
MILVLRDPLVGDTTRQSKNFRPGDTCCRQFCRHLEVCETGDDGFVGFSSVLRTREPVPPYFSAEIRGIVPPASVPPALIQHPLASVEPSLFIMHSFQNIYP